MARGGTPFAIVLGLLILAPAAHAGPTVSVRVEGQSATLLERTTVTLGDGTEPNTGCPAASASAAIEAATGGNWDRRQFTQTILGEQHAFANSDYWAEWIGRGGGYVYGGGICTDLLQDGDELLMLVDRSPAGQSTVFPLAIEGLPVVVQRSEPVTITVVEYRNPSGTIGAGTRTPVAGAQVAGATTDADGRATLSFAAEGAFTVKATRPGNAPSAALPVAVRATGSPLPARDVTRPLSRLTGIANGQRYRNGPRTIIGTVTDASRLHSVKLRLTRRDRGRCWTFSGRTERFRRTRCGRGSWFRIGAEPRFSYLLPARLPRGRYVLDAKAIDAAFNREETLERGRNRVVFRVG